MPDPAGLPEEAVRAAAEAIWEDGLGPIKAPEEQARDALTAALPYLRDAIAANVREQVAQKMDDMVAFYHPTIWSPDSESSGAIAAKAMRHAYSNAARIARTPQRSDTEGNE